MRWLTAVLAAAAAGCATMLSPGVLEDAVAYARSQADAEPSDLHRVIFETFSAIEPDYRVLGPTFDRAGDSGMVLHDGDVVAQWGDVDRPDMAFAVAQGPLSALAGIAVRDGLIGSLDDRVADYLPDLFIGAHNVAITWRQLLQQTSEWSGMLWAVPEWADRPASERPDAEPLQPPGTRFKYNDVRVNLLALALMRVFGEPLPAVFEREIMAPIGGSGRWQWHGYENSWVEVDGELMQSVAGNGHFGGGLFMSTRDLARFGELMRQRGVWRGRRILPDAWFDRIRTPSAANPDYGYLWWLNTGRRAIPAAPPGAYWVAGFGGNYLYVDECNELVIVLRWIPDLAGVVTRVIDSMQYATGCG